MKYIERTMMIAALLSLVLSFPATANIAMPPLISNNMVIQANRPFKAWGQADANEAVQIEFRNTVWNTTADALGKWEIDLGSFTPGGPFNMVVTGNNTITITNILVGEVWLAGGQSNMVWNVNSSDDSESIIAAANYPQLRYFYTDSVASTVPLDEVDGYWVECNPSNAPWFSAVAYSFGREIHQTLNQPVGIIRACQGGTRIEAWMSHESLAAIDMDRGIDNESEYFNGTINALQKYSMRGVLWYQGESNIWAISYPTDTPYASSTEYSDLLPAMIQDWRTGWDHEDLEFLIVQLPNYRTLQSHPASDSIMANVRDAQLQTALHTPDCGLTIILDLGGATVLHPTNKEPVGHRLALNARALLYGETSLVYSGPIATSWLREGDSIRVMFDHAGSGLASRDAGSLIGFTVKADGESWQWADAQLLDNNTVRITCDACPKPDQIRYAWDDNPLHNLVNSENLPASPFQATVTANYEYRPADPDTVLKCRFTSNMTSLIMVGMMIIILNRKSGKRIQTS